MEWKDIYPRNIQPSMDEIADYIGGDARKLWTSLVDYMNTVYKTKPRLTYSVCAGKPGWNVKFQKSGQSFGTFYPEENSFSVFLVISYRHVPLVDAMIPGLSPATAELYKQAGDYMKIGRWMMFQIRDAQKVEDYKKLVSVKLAAKAV